MSTVSEKKQSPGLLHGFRAFLMRGNVVDLAVAVVVGAAFTSIVNSVVNGLINPVVGAIGTKDLSGYRSCLTTCHVDAAGHSVGVYLLWGAVLSAVLNFLITSAVVYFLMVAPMARFLARRAARHQQEKAAEETELAVLREIRDALLEQQRRNQVS